jgi:hypothetical protein
MNENTEVKSDDGQPKFLDGDERMKVISFVIAEPVPDHGILKIEYPELDKMLNDGYEIADTLPSYGNGNYYFITFVLRTKREKKVRTMVGFRHDGVHNT